MLLLPGKYHKLRDQHLQNQAQQQGEGVEGGHNKNAVKLHRQPRCTMMMIFVASVGVADKTTYSTRMATHTIILHKDQQTILKRIVFVDICFSLLRV